MKQQGVSVKGQLIVKTDGKQQLALRVVDPLTGRVDKYLVNINPFDHAKPHNVKINNVDTQIGMVVAAVTGYHKGSKDLSQVSNKMARFEPLNVVHTFPAAQAQASFGQPAATSFVPQAQAAPTNTVGTDEIPF